MNKYIRRTVLNLALLFSLLSFGQKDTTIVQILHLNDLHAKIERFPQLKFVVDSIRANNGDVFLLSAGDLFSGNPIVDRNEKKGFPIIDLMNDLGFNGSALGNHDFDYGQVVQNERREDAHFPFICANIDASSAELDQPEPYLILKTKNGLQIAVVSILQIGDNGLPDSHPRFFKDLKLLSPDETIKNYKKELKDYDMQVALTHLGYRKDLEIAEANSWLDLIIGGHSHTTLDPATLVGQTWVTQAGSNVKYLGVNTVMFVGKKLVSIQNQLIPLKDKSKDSIVEAKVKGYAKNPALQVPIAYLSYDIDTPEEIGELMANAYREGLGVDIAFQNIGGVRINRLKEDTLKLMDVMYLDPFNNEIMTFDMTAKDLISFFRYAFTVRHKNNQLISGLKAEFKTDNNGDLIDLILKDMDGNPLDENKIFTVAINSYMASSYEFSVKDKAKYTAKFSNDLIIDYLKTYFPLKK